MTPRSPSCRARALGAALSLTTPSVPSLVPPSPAPSALSPPLCPQSWGHSPACGPPASPSPVHPAHSPAEASPPAYISFNTPTPSSLTQGRNSRKANKNSQGVCFGSIFRPQKHYKEWKVQSPYTLILLHSCSRALPVRVAYPPPAPAPAPASACGLGRNQPPTQYLGYTPGSRLLHITAQSHHTVSTPIRPQCTLALTQPTHSSHSPAPGNLAPPQPRPRRSPAPLPVSSGF